MSIGLKSDSSGTSGSIAINGSDKVVITSDGNVTAGTFTGAVVGALTGSLTAGGSVTSGVAVAATSGTAIDFTGIPSWAKRITISINAVSFSGLDHGLIQIGVGSSPTTSGYSAATNYLVGGSASGALSSSDGFIWFMGAAGYVDIGTYILTKHSGNTWVGSSVINCFDVLLFTKLSNGKITLSGDLGMIRVKGSLGGAFDGTGSINIMYEG
jgi:hypothetical protein